MKHDELIEDLESMKDTLLDACMEWRQLQVKIEQALEAIDGSEHADFRKYFKKTRKRAETLKFSSQLLLAHILLRAGQEGEGLTVRGAANLLGYSGMTMTRAFDELVAKQLVESYAIDNRRYLRLIATPLDTWTKAQPFLRSPVWEKRREWQQLRAKIEQTIAAVDSNKHTDFRRYFQKTHKEPKTLRICSQSLLIHLLLHTGHDVLTLRKVASLLGYSGTAMTRAFNELTEMRLAGAYADTAIFMNSDGITAVGTARHIRLIATPLDTWTKAQPFLRSPVEKKIYIKKTAICGPLAGRSALAGYTRLPLPPRLTVALSQKQWLVLRRGRIEVSKKHPNALEIEIWSYPPSQITDRHLVDPLSLYLSLRDSYDKRVEASLVALMERVEWQSTPCLK